MTQNQELRMTALSVRSSSRTVIGTAGAAVLLLGLAACGSGSSSSTATPAPSSPPTSASASSSASAGTAIATGTLSAVDQTGDGTTLTVANVDLKGVDAGWIAVHSDLAGKPGPVVGQVQVKKGDTPNVKVTLDNKVATGAYWPMLHVDDHAVGTYEFPKVPGADLPVKSGSDIVMQKITLTVR